jgi:hypothetical protein
MAKSNKNAFLHNNNNNTNHNNQELSKKKDFDTLGFTFISFPLNSVQEKKKKRTNSPKAYIKKKP